ncbi:MAG: phosphoglycerate kinase [Acidobacteriota bacterium]|nr:phosphoglycerate kinase [Acidobacteriota bacterium]
MTRLSTLDDLGPLAGRTVFMRADLNVALDGREILDDTRIRATLPTLDELRAGGARVLVYSHLGRPKGERHPEMSLEPVARALAQKLGTEVRFAEDCVGPLARDAAEATPEGGVTLFENLRYHAGEQRNDWGFVDALAGGAEVYVDDAFGCAHRAHASIVGVPHSVARRAAGRLLERESSALGRLLAGPEPPFVVILGGAKISSKISTLENLLPRIDVLLVGGAMANTFLASQGAEMADSLVAEDELDLASRLLADAAAGGIEVVLPTDLVATDRVPAGPDDVGTVQECSGREVPSGFLAVDVGPATSAAFADRIAEAKTVFWNGPPGLFERPPFDIGSRTLARSIADSTAFTVVGGGETVAVTNLAGVADRIDHVSTGGGAALEFLAGKKLPGIAVLEIEA